mmetsp:Transcript_4378/g.10261  ORF Transcript_4378/g.10261 Transcript_4378/m.10261 type:complete len:214 (+) Transcript_4378:35-676(+)
MADAKLDQAEGKEDKGKQESLLSSGDASKNTGYDWDFQGLHFRRIMKDDLDELAALHDVLFPVKYSESFFNSLLRKDMMTILAFDKKDSSLVGVSTARVEEDHESCYGKYDGYISTLGVRPGFRRCGLGGFLLKKTIAILEDERNCATIKLHVHAENIAAINLYYKHGFVLVEHLVNHYYFDDKNHDALHLVHYNRSWKRFDNESETAACTIV